MGVLALRALCDILQKVALHLHAWALCSMIGGLYKSVKVVVCDARVVARACSSGPMDLLLVCHTAVAIRGDLEAKRALTLTLIFTSCAASKVTSKRRLTYLLLNKLLVLFVLLNILLEELSQICIKLIIALLVALCLTLLSRRLRSVE